MRQPFKLPIVVLLLPLVLAACVSVSQPTAQPGGPTIPPGLPSAAASAAAVPTPVATPIPTTALLPTVAPVTPAVATLPVGPTPTAGGATVTVVMSSGTDAGTYAGATAVIHFSGSSTETPLGPGGVKVDVTVNCPSVTRS